MLRSCDNETLRFVYPRSTRETHGIAAELFRWWIASEAPRRNMSLRSQSPWGRVQKLVARLPVILNSLTSGHTLQVICAGDADALSKDHFEVLLDQIKVALSSLSLASSFSLSFSLSLSLSISLYLSFPPISLSIFVCVSACTYDFVCACHKLTYEAPLPDCLLQRVNAHGGRGSSPMWLTLSASLWLAHLWPL